MPVQSEQMSYVSALGQPKVSGHSAALLLETLHLLLGDSALNADWQAWAKGPTPD